MTSWDEVEAAAPELAEVARTLFDAHKHKILATLRRDGSPRVSGIETVFADGELYVGSMPGAVKARDLRRDPRMALHSASVDPPDDPSAWPGDAKLSGRVVEITDADTIARVVGSAETGSHLFRVDVAELVLTRVGDPPDHLVIESWNRREGYRRRRR